MGEESERRPGRPLSVSLAITAVMAGLGLGAGVVIGYLLQPEGGIQRGLEGGLDGHMGHNHNASAAQMLRECRKDTHQDPAISNFLLEAEVAACAAAECHVPLPRTHVVYRLARGQQVTVDGRLDDPAWQEVAFTSPFVDISGEGSKAPRFETKVKLRWDTQYLYVGAYLEERAVWANKTLHDTTVYQDNSFQVLLDTARSNHKYKEISINALGTIADLMLTRSYLDDGEPLQFWESDVIRAVHINGPLNDPSRPNRFWSVEMALPFTQLYAGLGRESDVPKDREIWRANFVRSEWQSEIVGNKYQKSLDSEADWWVWQSPGVANIHLPDRWGLLQFRDAAVNASSFTPGARWLTANALMDVYRAQKAYKAVTGRYTTNTHNLRLPPYVLSRSCVRNLDIRLDWGGFRVSATAAHAHGDAEVGHTRTDRLLWFGDEKENF